MSDRETPDQDLPEDVAQFAAALREGVPVRREWRGALLRELSALPAPGRRGRGAPGGRRLVLSPLGAAAAGLACIAMGAAGAMVLRDPPPADRVPAVASHPDASSGNRTVADARLLGMDRQGGGTSIRFVIVAPAASRVSVVGNFNGWDPLATPMERLEGGDAWVRDVVLDPGRHAYAFFVDGAIHVDPSAPRAAEDDFGIPSSALVVRAVPQ